mmetsp:Transcript_34468/g.35056  ORF Transcript_34468/g.35056 Transcript_34468/m.35056 type:complete len:171 (+) Transcript_34468:114-626(+)
MAVDGEGVQDSCLTTENTRSNCEHQKIDHITSLQEGIDSLSLSLFEALRGLRDAVAPESGNLGGTTQVNNDSPNNNINESSEMEKDVGLVKKAASTVLKKSADIDRRVSSLPGMKRTRTEQMKYIEELLEKNRKTAKRLEEAYNRAEERRKKVRKFVRDHTCESLGIIED